MKLALALALVLLVTPVYAQQVVTGDIHHWPAFPQVCYSYDDGAVGGEVRIFEDLDCDNVFDTGVEHYVGNISATLGTDCYVDAGSSEFNVVQGFDSDGNVICTAPIDDQGATAGDIVFINTDGTPSGGTFKTSPELFTTGSNIVTAEASNSLTLTMDCAGTSCTLNMGGDTGDTLNINSDDGNLVLSTLCSGVCAGNSDDIHLVADNIKIGDGADEDIVLTFDRSSSDPTFRWDDSANAFVVSQQLHASSGIGFRNNGFVGLLQQTVTLTAARNWTFPDLGGEICVSNSCVALSASNVTIRDGVLTSEQANTATSWALNNATARSTGNMVEFQDNGTAQVTINSAGNLQMANSGRIFNANGNDESVYGSTYGNLTMVENLTTSAGGTTAVNARFLADIKINSTSSSLVARNLWISSLFDPSGNGTTVTSVIGAYYEAIDESTGTGHTLTNLIAQSNFVQTTKAGTITIANMTGAEYFVGLTGTNTTITAARNIYIKSPTASPGAGTVIQRMIGVEIEDLRGHGTLANAAIRIFTQAADSGDEGNIDFMGDGYNTGHLQMNNCHLWNDATEALRAKCSVPTSDTDGELLMASGVTTHGEVHFGTTDASFDTGTEVCAGFGKTCADSYLVGSATPVACGTTHAASFYAFCY